MCQVLSGDKSCPVYKTQAVSVSISPLCRFNSGTLAVVWDTGQKLLVHIGHYKRTPFYPVVQIQQHWSLFSHCQFFLEKSSVVHLNNTMEYQVTLVTNYMHTHNYLYCKLNTKLMTTHDFSHSQKSTNNWFKQ